MSFKVGPSPVGAIASWMEVMNAQSNGTTNQWFVDSGKSNK